MDDRRMFHPITFRILYFILRVAFRICHPVIHIQGRETLPDGPAVLCANHSHLTDPIWIVVWARLSRHPRIMAKKELFRNKAFGRILTKLGAFPVDRGNTDIGAIKNAMRTLKSGNKLLIFPEGTRVRKGKTSEPHAGAVLIAHRVNVPIVPVYLSVKKGLFRPITLKFGTPYHPDFGNSKPTSDAMDQHATELMHHIYAMGESK